MGCDSRRSGCSTGPHGGRRGVRSRVGIWLCLLAFALQFTDQAMHMWEVATEPGVVAVPWVLGNKQSTTTLAAVDHVPQRPPHNPALCSICQALSRLQGCLLVQSWTTGTSTTGAWLVPTRTAYVCNLSLSATAPRAPPCLS
jgi:hypothetical protein